MGNLQETVEVCYIYGLSSTKNVDNIRYIGYSTVPEKRFKNHINESKQLKYRRHKWVQNELKNNNSIVMTILRCVDINSVSKEEINTILLYKSFGANLVNGNNGGFGGISPTKEVKEKIRLSKIGNSWNKGRKPSESNRLAVIESNKRPKTEVTRKKISESNIGKISANRILDDNTVIQLISFYNQGKTTSEILTLLPIKKSSIYNIISGKYYKDIVEKYNLKWKSYTKTNK